MRHGVPWGRSSQTIRARPGQAMKLEPVGDHVVIKRVEHDERSAGGIHLLTTSREPSTEGRVLSVGDGRLLADGRRIPHQVREGDRVLIARYAGVEVMVLEETLLIVREDEILAVLE